MLHSAMAAGDASAGPLDEALVLVPSAPTQAGARQTELGWLAVIAPQASGGAACPTYAVRCGQSAVRLSRGRLVEHCPNRGAPPIDVRARQYARALRENVISNSICERCIASA